MADKTKSIKNATDKELDELLIRIRKEGELQSLIAELKRRGSPNYLPYDNPQISTEESIESLYHFGVLGMKWGKRLGGLRRAVNKANGAANTARKESMAKSRASSDSHKLGSFRRAVNDSNKAAAIARKDSLVKSVKDAKTQIKRNETRSYSDDHKEKIALKKKKIHEMSNTDLRKINERLQLEKSYKELRKNDLPRGQKFVTDMLTTIAKQSATNYVTQILTKGVSGAVQQIVK